MDAERSRSLVASAYGVALLTVAIGATDIITRILPMRPGEAAWRLGSVGVVTLSLPSLLLAVLVAALTARYLGHRLILRSLAVACLAASAVMLASLPFFALDAVEMRRLVQPEGRGSFQLTMIRAASTVLLASGLMGWMGYAGWRSSRPQKAAGGRVKAKVKAGKEERAGGILVGREG